MRQKPVHKDGGNFTVDRAEICAGQLNLASGQRGGGENVVDAREAFSSGLGVGLGHGLYPYTQQ
jgi:hypothetical protein